MNPILQQLKNKHLLWQASANDGGSDPGVNVSVGYAALNNALRNGFPEQGVIDIQSQPGSGELRLLLPYLQSRQQKDQRMLILIAPPCLPNSEMLLEQQFPLEQVIVVYPDSPKAALWSAEQSLKSGCCHSVLLWHNELEIHQVKRLQLAAEQGDALLTVYRKQVADSMSLPFTLSLAVKPHPQGVDVTILKQKKGWPGAHLVVDMQDDWPELTLAPQPDNLIPFRHSRAS